MAAKHLSFPLKVFSQIVNTVRDGKSLICYSKKNRNVYRFVSKNFLFLNTTEYVLY